jgi:hypothetical protein
LRIVEIDTPAPRRTAVYITNEDMVRKRKSDRQRDADEIPHENSHHGIPPLVSSRISDLTEMGEGCMSKRALDGPSFNSHKALPMGGMTHSAKGILRLLTAAFLLTMPKPLSQPDS